MQIVLHLDAKLLNLHSNKVLRGMAEVSIWAQDDANSQGIRQRMASVCEVLRKDCRAGRQAPGFIPEMETSRQEKSWGGERVHDALQVLLSALEGGSADADKAATEFGRNGGHIFLLQLLETEGVDDESDRTRELAATAVEHCMSLCARFPMKAATVDAKNVCDTMRCEIEIDSALNRCGGVVKVYLRRRSTPNDTAPAPRLICILCLFKRLCLMSLNTH